MKVSELIEKLKTLDQDQPIVIIDGTYLGVDEEVCIKTIKYVKNEFGDGSIVNEDNEEYVRGDIIDSYLLY